MTALPADHMAMKSGIFKFVAGTLGGLSATGPMTIAMSLLYRHLPSRLKYPLPPREVTGAIVSRAGLKMNDETRDTVALVNHFGYGAAMGALYALLAGKGHNGLIKGLLFGSIVWLVSYLAILPAASLLRPATQHPPKRNLLMLAAHWIWGAFVGVFLETLMKERYSAEGAFSKSQGANPGPRS